MKPYLAYAVFFFYTKLGAQVVAKINKTARF